MQNSILSWIRKRQSALQVFVALMVNLMVFSQPLSYALNRSNVRYIANSYSSYYDVNALHLEKDISLTNPTDNVVGTRTVVEKTVTAVSLTPATEELDPNTILSIEKQGIIGKTENIIG